MDEYDAGTASSRRRRLRAPVLATLAVLMVASSVALAAKDSTTEHSAADDAPTCPGGEVIATPPLDAVRVPAFESPREAAEGWAGPDPGELAVNGDQEVAYLRRHDGTVRARMHLDSTRADLDEGESTSWWVNGSEVCSDEISHESWEGADEASCPGGTVRAQIQHPPGGDRRLLSAEEAPGFADPRHDQVEIELTEGATSGDVTVTVSGPSGPHTWLRQLRVDDTWRVHELVACASQLPGLSTAGVTQLVRLDVGHCWVEPLTYGDGEWALASDLQFGWGGEMPSRWTGYGSVTPRTTELRYVDASGAVLHLLPADDPRTKLPGGGRCA